MRDKRTPKDVCGEARVHSVLEKALNHIDISVRILKEENNQNLSSGVSGIEIYSGARSIRHLRNIETKRNAHTLITKSRNSFYICVINCLFFCNLTVEIFFPKPM